VFLGPGGAQVNMPQAYWRAIGGGVDKVIARTVAENAIYGRPMAFIGQLYQRPTPDEIDVFRGLAQAFGAPGVSFWSWQSAAPSGWSALNRPLKVPVTRPDIPPVVLKRGSHGDQVRLLQMKLGDVRVTGRFDQATEDALFSYQAAQGLPATGRTDWPTWAQLNAPDSASASQRS
jgi:peptidoglycan hydrolase-like protein with peptidoglycan-binding domain